MFFAVTCILYRFVVGRGYVKLHITLTQGLRISVGVEVSADAGTSQQKVEEIDGALLELGKDAKLLSSSKQS